VCGRLITSALALPVPNLSACHSACLLLISSSPPLPARTIRSFQTPLCRPNACDESAVTANLSNWADREWQLIDSLPNCAHGKYIRHYSLQGHTHTRWIITYQFWILAIARWKSKKDVAQWAPFFFCCVFCCYKPKFHLDRHVSTRDVRRVKPMHFGCVELVEQHASARRDVTWRAKWILGLYRLYSYVFVNTCISRNGQNSVGWRAHMRWFYPYRSFKHSKWWRHKLGHT